MKSRRRPAPSSAPAPSPSREPGRDLGTGQPGNDFLKDQLASEQVESDGPFSDGLLNEALSAAFGQPLGGLSADWARDDENAALGADATTSGTAMSFASHVREDASDPDAMEIIAHETAHALAGGGSGATLLDEAGDAGEAAADRAGQQFRAWAEAGFEGPAPRLEPARGGRAEVHRHNHYGSVALTGRPVLKRGSAGQYVKSLQSLLNRHGADLVVDGSFGPATEAALIDFQRERGLLADGMLGPHTARVLNTPVGVGSGAFTGRPALERGSNGPAVRALQVLLNENGASLAVDGSFGPATHAAVVAFQQRNGLLVDGVAGLQTAGALHGGQSAPAPSTEAPATQAPTELTGKPMLRFGNRGPLVGKLQALLNTKGANLGTDGVFGARTDQAVRSFQAANRLSVDGVVGPGTVAVLRDPSSKSIRMGGRQGPALGSTEGFADLRDAVITAAESHLGAPYYWGADGPSMFDCSGFALYVLRQETGLVSWGDDTAAGISNRLPKTNSPKKGDLVFYRGRGGVTHVTIAMGQGDLTIGASSGGSNTFGNDPNAKVKYTHWGQDSRSKSFGSIDGLIRNKLNS